jgi:aminoglycoside phosphotransferase (APT) family kinase protein
MRQALSVPRVLAETQARLHAIEAQVLLASLSREGFMTGGVPVDHRATTLDGHLAQVTYRAATLEGMATAARWLLDYRPQPPETAVICHGDFHPGNILMSGDRVTGVVDWSLALVAEAEFDVGSTLVLLTLGPIEPEPRIEAIASLVRGMAARRYLRRYAALRPLDRERLRYYSALRCFTSLVWTIETRQRLAAGEGGGPTPWDRPRVLARLIAQFTNVTGVPLAVPASSDAIETLGSPLHNVERGRG